MVTIMSINKTFLFNILVIKFIFLHIIIILKMKGEYILRNENIKTLYKGAIIGGTMLVPGVSGGSMAMIIGIYSDLISSVSSFFKDAKKNIIFLFLFVIGAGFGMVIFSRPLLALIETYTVPMMYFFIGAVIGGIPMIYNSAGGENITYKDIFLGAVGLIAVMSLSFLPQNIFAGENVSSDINMIWEILAGIIAAIALVLPGVSVSYMLLLMGMYDKTVYAISELDIIFLLPMGMGLLLGIVLTTKLLEYVLKNYKRVAYMTILGFIFGSIIQVFPGLPRGYDWIISIMLLIFGYFLISTISRKE